MNKITKYLDEDTNIEVGDFVCWVGRDGVQRFVTTGVVKELVGEAARIRPVSRAYTHGRSSNLVTIKLTNLIIREKHNA